MGQPAQVPSRTPQLEPNSKNRTRLWLLIPLLCFISLSTLRLGLVGPLTQRSQPASTEPAFPDLPRHCTAIPPISSSVLEARRNTLAKRLHQLGAAAYIAEPSSSAAYYFNVSEAHWRLSERPLLFVVTPSVDGVSDEGDVTANVSLLTPKFEATRAKLLPLSPSAYIQWAEEEDPFAVLFDALHLPSNSTVYIDGNARFFVADGLQRALPRGQVQNAPPQVVEIRERKTPEEISILRCANEATLLAIRATHKRMHIGMHESDARELVAGALAAVGLERAGCLTLFGENAALPHGSGTNRVLKKEDFALFDCTGQLHGYWSDVTRTLALPESSIPDDHLAIWHHVHAAQSLARLATYPGALTNHPDIVARARLALDGYGPFFTHRLGHGIGLDVHESPYLRGVPVSQATLIQTGHTFSNEPGVYIEGKVGVRLEDCMVVEEGASYATFLTAGVGGAALSPWEP
ncbi:Creatinase/aminopeptidase [Pleurotus eryngii]|uniref:Creatinase/aminopeptidase n=1 Tax=Pleurotus eryngii TaxID=5323 RepID=A0A9P6DK04_PLEER|nr:Creatinase/aminopeptidase [Pleurotus eryngii]